MTSVRILKEDVDPKAIAARDLTVDCIYVRRKCGQVDLVKSHAKVKVFDHYYDRGILVEWIEYAGGHLNPKFQEPRI